MSQYSALYEDPSALSNTCQRDLFPSDHTLQWATSMRSKMLAEAEKCFLQATKLEKSWSSSLMLGKISYKLIRPTSATLEHFANVGSTNLSSPTHFIPSSSPSSLPFPLLSLSPLFPLLLLPPPFPPYPTPFPLLPSSSPSSLPSFPTPFPSFLPPFPSPYFLSLLSFPSPTLFPLLPSSLLPSPPSLLPSLHHFAGSMCVAWTRSSVPSCCGARLQREGNGGYRG